MGLILLVLIIVALGAVVVVAGRRNKERELSRREEEVAPVRKLAFEDITAFGEDLQELDSEMSGHELDAGANADYQRALDSYELAKFAGDSITQPEDIRHVTQIIEDGRYAIACVRSRVEGVALPTRRPPCFFDPRHGLSVADVPYVPPDGVERDVPPAPWMPSASARRRPRRPQGDGRGAACPVLAGWPRLRALRRGLLRRLRPDDVDVHGRHDVRRLRGGGHGGGGDGGGDGGEVATAAASTGAVTAAASTAAASTAAASTWASEAAHSVDSGVLAAPVRECSTDPRGPERGLIGQGRTAVPADRGRHDGGRAAPHATWSSTLPASCAAYWSVIGDLSCCYLSVSGVSLYKTDKAPAPRQSPRPRLNCPHLLPRALHPPRSSRHDDPCPPGRCRLDLRRRCRR